MLRYSCGLTLRFNSNNVSFKGILYNHMGANIIISSDHAFRFEYYKDPVINTRLINCTTFVELGIHRGNLQFPFLKVSSETVEKPFSVVNG
jgi:hypothetical protein